VFQNLIVAEATAREIGRITLSEALKLTALIAAKEPRRHQRAPVQWLRLYLEECKSTTSLEDVGLVVATLAALPAEAAHSALRQIATKPVRAVSVSSGGAS
jgi:hypothetical protein